MIPLAAWLQDCRYPRAREVDTTATIPDSDDTDVDGESARRSAKQAEERLLQLDDALEAARLSLLQEREQWTAREAELRQQFASDMAVALRDQVITCLNGLQHALEQSLADALIPFLSREAVKQAHHQLIGLLHCSVEHEGAVLEVRAPGELHQLFREKLDEAGMQAVFIESPAIEVLFDARRARFELLSQRWIQILEDHVHGE